MAKQKRIIVQIPLLTVAIVAVSVVAYRFPLLSNLLVYDRQAVLSGDWWRLITAPLVHFSAGHLYWNILVFGAAGWAVEAGRYTRFWFVCCFISVFPGLCYLLTAPELHVYGGLSGLATGAVAFFCIHSLLRTNKNRMIWIAILALTALKIIAESLMDAPIFVHDNGISFRVLPSVHLWGVLGALAGTIPAIAQRGLLRELIKRLENKIIATSCHILKI